MGMKMDRWKKYGKQLLLFLIISVLVEVFLFNSRAFFSLHATNQWLNFTQEEYTLTSDTMSGEPGVLYVNLHSWDETGEAVPLEVIISAWDEGNALGYQMGSAVIYPGVEKTKYLNLHSYGAVRKLEIVIKTTGNNVEVTDLIYDARVPFFISPLRIFLLFGVMTLLWALRPASALYSHEWKKREKCVTVGLLLTLHVFGLLFLIRSNPVFLQPDWAYHKQYSRLAEALCQGRLSIDAGSEEIVAALSAMENPYDTDLRQGIPGIDSVWDTCYYQGRFYVYFGIVPVLVFYLPYYILFHGAFPTWFAVFLSAASAFGGVFYLLGQIRRKWFQKIPYLLYLILATVMGNGMLLACAMLRAEFYWLPLLLSLAFSLWGLGLVLSGVRCWEEERGHCGLKLATGGLLLALTAGCRPQFLVGSCLLIPVFLPVLREKEKMAGRWRRLLALLIPYVIVAVGLMAYNQARFGSVFDFGANYNLTSNDMTRRGFNSDRLPLGIFMYLFQPGNLRLQFPFVEGASFYSSYLGATIRETTYGGAFFSHPVLLLLFCLPFVWKKLREKKAFGFAVVSLSMGLLVVLADTEMAGILNRYFMDFLWLLLIPAVLLVFCLWESFTDSGRVTEKKGLVWFVVLTGIWQFGYELAMGIQNTGLFDDNTRLYYLMKSLFS